MEQIMQYKFLVVPFMVWLVIQLFKFICDSIKQKKIAWDRLMGAGGMPSSHSAVVTALATLMVKEYGPEAPITALTVIFACVVMYDAAGVRRAAGKQASILNKMIEVSELKPEERLQEVLGHSPLQVLAGAIIRNCSRHPRIK